MSTWLSPTFPALRAQYTKLKQIADERYTAYILLVMSGAKEKGDGCSFPLGTSSAESVPVISMPTVPPHP